MKRVLLMAAILLASVMAATWTVTEKEAVTISATPWTNIQHVGMLLKGESGTILDQHDDWVEVEVTSSKTPGLAGKTGFVIEWAIQNGAVLAPGAVLMSTPGNDVTGKRIEVAKLGLLWPGDTIKVKGYTRPTYYLLEIKTKTFTGKGWVYCAYGIVKQ